jgi:hypothetical protein
LAGTVGGDVGEGTFTGETLTATSNDGGVTTIIKAVYRILGSKHSFTANIDAVQTRFDNNGVITVSGVITGVITDGWLKGGALEGGYTRYACPKGANGFCFDGTLAIEPPPLVTTIRASQVEVCWNSVSSLTYQVQYRSDLTANLWTSLGGCVLGDGSVKCVNDPIVAGQPQRFYRVVQTNCVPSP